ncbi:MAG TPA: hypothetical protein PLN34_01310 [Alloprevotella sp.]|nr:hypothetical protein [Alloprevotella sp.]
MKPQEYSRSVGKYADVIARIQASAHALHEHVNQTYDKVHPYGFHLDMVADAVRKDMPSVTTKRTLSRCFSARSITTASRMPVRHTMT